MTKPKLSGAQRRKLARERLKAENGGVLPRSTFVAGRPTRIIVGALDAVSDWKREIGRMFREARAGTLPSDEAARLSYIAQLGVRVAQIEEELAHARAIGEALERSQAGQLNGHAPIGNALPLLAADAEPVPQ